MKKFTKLLSKKKSKKKSLKGKVQNLAVSLNKKRKDFLSRRPHRSFRRTKRRDYKRSMKVPGYISLTLESFKVVTRNKWTFLGLALFYSLLTLALSNAMSQDAYRELS